MDYSVVKHSRKHSRDSFCVIADILSPDGVDIASSEVETAGIVNSPYFFS